MAWEARLGLKQLKRKFDLTPEERLNGLGSPSGIETLQNNGYIGVTLGLNGLGSPSGIETTAVPSVPGLAV